MYIKIKYRQMIVIYNTTPFHTIQLYRIKYFNFTWKKIRTVLISDKTVVRKLW